MPTIYKTAAEAVGKRFGKQITDDQVQIKWERFSRDAGELTVERAGKIVAKTRKTNRVSL
jgi:hypothetical protein